MNRKPQFIAGIFIVGVLVVAFFIFNNGDRKADKEGVADLDIEAALWQAVGGDDGADSDSKQGDGAPMLPGQGGFGDSHIQTVQTTGAGSEVDVSEWNFYFSDLYGFSFRHPENIRFTQFEEGGGDMVLGQGEGRQSLQIFILPWDEGEERITPDRIRRDIPNLTIKNPQYVSVGTDASALIFQGNEPSFGATREVWMVKGGFLYQMTAPIEFDAMLARIMGTWEFL